MSSLKPGKKVSENDASKVGTSNYLTQVVMYNSFVSGYSKELVEVGIDVVVLPRLFGGPSALKQYRALIDLPYQTSTMKMYENLAMGVITLVPTPAYLKKLVAMRGKYGYC